MSALQITVLIGMLSFRGDVASSNSTLETVNDINSLCIPNEIYKLDCNTCKCLPSKTLVCTKMFCMKKSNPKRVARKETMIQNIDRKCQPGEVIKNDCNYCYCNRGGSFVCTMTGCLNPTDWASAY